MGSALQAASEVPAACFVVVVLFSFAKIAFPLRILNLHFFLVKTWL